MKEYPVPTLASFPGDERIRSGTWPVGHSDSVGDYLTDGEAERDLIAETPGNLEARLLGIGLTGRNGVAVFGGPILGSRRRTCRQAWRHWSGSRRSSHHEIGLRGRSAKRN